MTSFQFLNHKRPITVHLPYFSTWRLRQYICHTSPRGVYGTFSPRFVFVAHPSIIIIPGLPLVTRSRLLAVDRKSLVDYSKRRMKTELFKALALVQLICAVVAHPAPATTTAVTLPRGGWFSGNGASERYRESLEQQVLQLDRQLRQARDEVAQLRARRTHSKPVVVGNKSDGDDTSDLEGKVRTLTRQIDELESAKSDLDGALTTSKLKIEELEQMISEEQEGSQQLGEKFEQDLQALQLSSYEKSEQNISDLETLMEERVAQAASDARLEVDQEMSSNIEQIKKELESSHQEELEAERKRSMEAVDAEKNKMRKLVKALAIREKKLAEQ
jgi:hypothetical protein